MFLITRLARKLYVSFTSGTNMTISHFKKNVNYVYEKVVVYWRKNLFLLPTGKVGQCYIDEIAKLMNDWAHDSPLKEIAFKAIMLMPNLLLQKRSKRSKSKNNLFAL